MLPVVIFVVVLVPLSIGAFLFVRRSKAAERAVYAGTGSEELEESFAEADAYTEEWRKEHPTRPDLLD